jgi:hypothetical protein
MLIFSVKHKLWIDSCMVQFWFERFNGHVRARWSMLYALCSMLDVDARRSCSMSMLDVDVDSLAEYTRCLNSSLHKVLTAQSK